MKRYLQPGYKFSLNGIDGYFEIKDIIGCGSSCVVYSADFTDKNGICTEHLLKEYNPKTLDIARDESGAIFVDNSDDVDAFEKGLVSFEKGYNIQLEIRRNLETKNTTANIQGIHEGNGTKYIDMTVFNGQTYDKIQESTLFDLLERTKAITKVIREYHKKGFLHLDLKPNNILALPETKELVMFFDFDSLLTKGEILSGGSVSYTKSWAAPELLLPGRRSKLCEATDIFSIGEIMFYQIFGRHSSPEERRSFANYEFEPNAEIFKDADQSIFKLLSELFSRTICGVISKRYASADELIEMLDRLLPLANPKRTRIISTLPSVQSFFVGRDSEIEEIHGKLQENDLLFVSGMGGIGKSELVKNYANRYKDSYDAIIFAPYVTDLVMLITDDKSVSIANVEMLQGEQLTEYYDRKLRKLKELCNERTLFIIDNYDTQEDPNFKAVQSLNCKKIITTRFDFADFNVSQIEIGTISARSDVNRIFNEYYGKSLSEEDKTTVDKIIDLVDCHTMTVELLAKQMKSGRVTPQKMLEVLTKGGLGESGKEKINAAKDSKFVRQSAYDHIRALFDISDLEENELYVLGNLSLIPHSGIFTEQFKVWCGLESYEEINSLENEGWIRRNKEDDIISLHPVVSDIAFELVKNESVNVEKLLCGITEYMSSDEYDTVDFEKRKDMNVLSMFCAERINKCSIETSAVADLLDRIANEVKGFGNLDLCYEFAEKAMRIRVNLFGDTSKEAAKSYKSLGKIFRQRGDLKKSEELFLKSLEIRESVFGEMNKATASSYSELGNLYRESGKLEKAEEFCLKAMEIREAVCGEMNGDTATSYNNLGILYRNLGELEKAEEFYLKALEIRRNIYGEMYSDTATSYNNLGVLYKELGRFEKAEEFYLKALKTRKSIYGEMYSDTATSYSQIGLLYKEQGQLEKAEEFYLKALNIRRSIYGEMYSDTATSYNNLGVLYKELGQLEKAEEFYLKALNIRRNIYGELYSSTATSYNSLGALYKEQGQLEKAEEFYLKALEIRRSIYGEMYSDTANSYSHLGSLYRKQGQLEKAEEFYLKALNIRRNIYGEMYRDTATSYNNLGVLYKKQGQLEKSEEFYLKALNIRKRIYGELYSDTATSYSNLGGLYREQGQLEKAEEFYLKALEIRRSIFGEMYSDTATSYNNLGSLYKELGQLEKAEEFYLKALDIRRSIYGEMYSDTATSYDNIGIIYKEQGKLEKAEEFYLKALEIRRSIYGEMYSDTAASYNNLGVLYRKGKKYEKAEMCIENALHIFKEIYGENNFDTSVAYSALGELYKLKNDFENAEKNLMKSFEIRKKIYGDNYPRTALVCYRLAELYFEHGQFSSAEKFSRKAYETYLNIYGEDDRQTADARTLLDRIKKST